MKYKHFIVVMTMLVVSMNAAAQRNTEKDTEEELTPDTALVVKNFIDSLAVLRHELDSIRRVNDSLRTEANDGRYFRLFAPPTFYHSGANKSFSISPVDGDEVTNAVDEALMSLYMRRPDLVLNNESRLKEAGKLRDDVNKKVKQKVTLVEKAAPVPQQETEVVPIELVIKKPNFWKFSGNGFVQFLQNYVSENWHKGGESNYSAVGSVTLDLNYNDKDRVTFENKLEMKLGFQTSRADTVHKFKPNNDLIRYTGKFGLQAHKRWYYMLQVLAYTQFTRGLKANDRTIYSDFMSPFNLNIGLGMDYKVEALNKKLTGTLNFSPLSYNFRYVGRGDLATNYGIREGRHTLDDFGSQLTISLSWDIAEQISWKTRLYGFTSYERAQIEWENTFTLKVSKYISANLFLYPRFDDAGKRHNSLGYWQFQEYSSIGLNYNF